MVSVEGPLEFDARHKKGLVRRAQLGTNPGRPLGEGGGKWKDHEIQPRAHARSEGRCGCSLEKEMVGGRTIGIWNVSLASQWGPKPGHPLREMR